MTFQLTASMPLYTIDVDHDEWFGRFENYLKAAEITGERRASTLRVMLGPDISPLVTALARQGGPAEKKATENDDAYYLRLKDLIREKVADRLSESEWRKRFHEREQKEDENCSQFINDLLKLVASAYPDADESQQFYLLKKQATSGMKEKRLRMTLAMKKPKTLEELLTTATEEEKNSRAADKPKKKELPVVQVVKEGKPEPEGQMKDRIEQLLEKVEKVEQTLKKVQEIALGNGGRGRGGRGNGGQRGRGFGRGRGNGGQAGAMGGVQCHRCLHYGHIQRDCYTKLPKQGDSADPQGQGKDNPAPADAAGNAKTPPLNKAGPA